MIETVSLVKEFNSQDIKLYHQLGMITENEFRVFLVLNNEDKDIIQGVSKADLKRAIEGLIEKGQVVQA